MLCVLPSFDWEVHVAVKNICFSEHRKALFPLLHNQEGLQFWPKMNSPLSRVWAGGQTPSGGPGGMWRVALLPRGSAGSGAPTLERDVSPVSSQAHKGASIPGFQFPKATVDKALRNLSTLSLGRVGSHNRVMRNEESCLPICFIFNQVVPHPLAHSMLTMKGSAKQWGKSPYCTCTWPAEKHSVFLDTKYSTNTGAKTEAEAKAVTSGT